MGQQVYLPTTPGSATPSYGAISVAGKWMDKQPHESKIIVHITDVDPTDTAEQLTVPTKTQYFTVPALEQHKYRGRNHPQLNVLQGSTQNLLQIVEDLMSKV
jgi:hypothetical protein